MRKMCKRTLGFYLTLLMLIMAACGRYEDAAPKASQGYEAGLQDGGTEAPQGHEADTQDGETEVSQGHEADAQDGQTDNSRVDASSASREDVSDLPKADFATNLPTYGDYYYDLANVVLYLEVYDELPPNYITKSEARELGWEGGSVEKYREGAAIGGDSFGNREGLLPKADGRSYTECDIDTDGYDSRGSRRLVFSNDGLYFYTSDHYETFSEVTVTEDYEVVW